MQKTRKSIKVVLIEDNSSDVRLIRGMLKKARGTSFEFESYTTLAAGLERLAGNKVDIVLLDLVLPDSRGLETLFTLRAAAPQIPVVILSGVGDEEKAVEAVQEGVQDYLVKGKFDSDLLTRAIRYAIERKQTEKALREGEMKYRTLFEAATDAIFLETLEGDILDCNAKACEMFGYTKEEITSLKVADLVTEEMAEKLPAIIDKELLTGGLFAETLQKRKDGAVFPAEVSIKVIERDEKQQVVTYVHDITPRKEMEETLRSNLTRTTALFHVARSLIAYEGLPDVLQSIVDSVAEALPANTVVLHTVDQDKQQLTHFVKGGSKSYSIVEVPYKELQKGLTGWVLREQKIALSPKGVPDVRESPEVQRSRRESGAGSIIVVPLNFRDIILGTMTAINRLDQPDFNTEDANLMMAMANQAAVAIETARLHEETLRLKEFNENIVQGIAEAILIMDARGIVTFSNPAAEELLEYSREELIGNYWKNFVPQTEREEAERYVAELTRGNIIRYETRLLRKGGELIHVILSARPRFSNDEFTGALVALTNITARVKVERALHRANRAYKTLSECNQAVVRATDEFQLLQDVCQIIIEVGGYHMAWVGFVENEDTKRIKPVMWKGREEGFLQAVNFTYTDTDATCEPTGISIQTGNPCVMQDIPSVCDREPWCLKALEREYASVIALPLSTSEQVFGALTIYAAQRDAFDNQEIELLKELASDLAYGITSLRTRAQRKRAEAALRASEKRYRTLFDRVPVGLYRVTPEGQILDANLAMMKLLGYSDRASLLATDMNDIYAIPEVRAQWRKKLEQDEVIRGFEVQLRRRDGAVIWVTDNTQAVRDVEGNIIYHEGSLEDITERKSAEDALQESERTLKTIMATVPVGIGMVKDRVLDWANEAMYRMVSWEQRALLGKSARVLYESDAEYKRVGQELYSEIAEHGIGRVETRWVRKDGSAFDCFILARDIDPADPSKGQIVAVTDITERKNMERQLIHAEKLSAIGQLAASINHEVSNPLQALVGILSLFQEEDISAADIHQYAHVAQGEVLRITRTLNRVRDFSKLTLTEEKEENDINFMVQQVLELITKQCQRTQVKVIWEPAPDLPLLPVVSDQIKQVFLNLVLNALDAMPKGGTLSVNASRTAEPLGVRVEFIDTGTGIDSDVLPRIFDPFFTTKETGTGLGLGISKNIIEKHNGYIEVETRPKEGTKFNVWLPAERS